MPTNAEVAAAFARAAPNDTRNENLIYRADDQAIYSYGNHWPLAVHDYESGYALLNGERRSVTTSRHATLVANALSYENIAFKSVSMKEVRDTINARTNQNRNAAGN